MNVIFLLTTIFCMMFACGIMPGEKEKPKILVVYFSHTGNTRFVAEQIKKITKGDIFEVIPAKDYPNDYQVLVELAKEEINSGYKPELKNKIKNIKDYNVIFIGSPNWWNTIAPPIHTFLADYDLSGKKIIPFMTHGGGGMGRIVADIKKLCPNSTFLTEYSCNGDDVKKAETEADIVKWLKSIGMIKK